MKTRKNKVLFVIIIVILFSVYIYFNYFSSVNLLSIDEKYRFLGLSRQDIYGFYDNERLENGLEFNWTSYEALKEVKIKANKIVIPVFCLKPDIKEEPVTVKISFNDKLVEEFILKDSRIKYLKYNIMDKGYKRGEYLEIKFEVDKLWSPAKYELSEDTRELGIGVGNIEFIR